MKRSHWLLILLLAGASGVAVNNWMEVERLRRMNRELRNISQTLQAQLAALTTNETSATEAELEQLRKDKQELLRLRSEATQLRAKAADAAKLRAENQQLRAAVTAGASGASTNSSRPASPGITGDQFPRDSWAFSGYATPEAALVSTIWAMREGNPRAYRDSLSPEEQARSDKAWANKAETEVAAKHQSDMASITGIQILERQNISADEMTMSVFVAGPNRTEQVSLVRSGGDWKFAGFVASPPK